MTTPPEEFRRRLNKLSAVHDKLATASTPQEVKKSIEELQLLETVLNKQEEQILDIVTQLEKAQRTIQEQVTSGGVFSLFKRKPTEEQDRQIREYRLRVTAYQNELLFARVLRTVTRTDTIPNLAESLQTTTKKKPTSGLDYYHYINSAGWKKKAEEAKARAGNRCQICNRSRAEVQLEAHHRTYERLGQELPDDITVLCRNCHGLYEDERRLEKPTKKCQTCGRTFAPLKPSHNQCLDCFLASKNRQTARQPAAAQPATTPSHQPIITCKRCGKEFVQTKASHQYCYDCYKQYHYQHR